MSGGTVKFDESYEVATSLSLTDRMFSLDLGNGKNVGIPYQLVYDLFKSNMDQLYRAISDSYTKEEVNGLVSLGMSGIEPTDSDDTVAGIKFPLESGTYTNYGGIVVDLTEGVTLIFSDGSGGFTKVLIPIDLTGYLTSSEAEAMTKIKVSWAAGKNLFNINAEDVALGAFIAGNGSTSSSGSYNTTGYMSAVAGIQYTASGARFWRFYDANKAPIGTTISNTASGAYSTTAPVGAVFQRVSVATSVWDILQVEEGGTSTAYESYQAIITTPGLIITPAQGQYFFLKSEGVGNASLPELLTPSKNLFNYKTGVPDKFVNWTNGNLATNDDFNASDYIPVESGENYTRSGPGATLHRAWYTANKTFIEGSQTSSWPATAPSNAAFIRFSYYLSTQGEVQFEKGNSATTYEPYGYIISKEIRGLGGDIISLKMASLGDSLTAQNKFQSKAISVLSTSYNIDHTNLGIGGTQMGGSSANAFWQDVRINSVPLDSQFVLVMGGTNDWANDRPLGLVDSVDTNDFTGAINKVIEKLITRIPSVKLAFGTPPYSEFIDYASRGWENAFENNNGNTINDYAAKVREVCLAKNLPVVDFNTAAAWNGHNITEFMTNDGALLHPNQTGADRMATELIAYIKKAYSG